MSAIPGGGIGFDVLVRTEQAKRDAADVTNRMKRMAQEVSRIKADVPVRIDTKRLQNEAAEAKRILRDVQREADRLARGRGGGGPGGPAGGGLTPRRGSDAFGGGAPGGGGGGGRGGGGVPEERLTRFATLMARTAGTARVLQTALEGVNAVMAINAAEATGNLEKVVEAQKRASSELRGISFFGIPVGALVGAAHDLKDRGKLADIAQTEEDALQGNRKADFMARQNARMRAERDRVRELGLQSQADRGATGTEIELSKVRQEIADSPAGKVREALQRREVEIAGNAAAEREKIEGDSFDRIAGIRERAAAEMLEQQGKTIEAERARLVAGFNATQRELEREAQFAENTGNSAQAARLRARARAEAESSEAGLRGFDRDQDRRIAADQGRRQEESRRRQVEQRQDDERRVQEGRQRGREAAEVEFEARQVFLQSRAGRRVGGEMRAEFETIQARAQREIADAVIRETLPSGEVRETANEPLQQAIRNRQAEELRALIEPGVGRAVGVSSASASLRSLNAPGEDRNSEKIEALLRNQILQLLGQIRDKDTTARTS